MPNDDPAIPIDRSLTSYRSLEINGVRELERQYMGIPTDTEMRRLVKKYVRITKELEACIDDIVQDRRTQWETFDQFARQAIYAFAAALAEAGYVHTGLAQEVEHERVIRQQANHARRRAEARDNLHKFDDELDTAWRERDWLYIMTHLRMLEAWLAGAPSPGAQARYRRTAAQSLSLQRAVKELVLWAAQEFANLDESDVALVERWRIAMEEWLLLKE